MPDLLTLYVYSCVIALVVCCQDWHHKSAGGVFLFEDDGSVVAHQYKLKLPEETSVYVTIEPCQEGKPVRVVAFLVTID